VSGLEVSGVRMGSGSKGPVWMPSLLARQGEEALAIPSPSVADDEEYYSPPNLMAHAALKATLMPRRSMKERISSGVKS